MTEEQWANAMRTVAEETAWSLTLTDVINLLVALIYIGMLAVAIVQARSAVDAARAAVESAADSRDVLRELESVNRATTAIAMSSWRWADELARQSAILQQDQEARGLGERTRVRTGLGMVRSAIDGIRRGLPQRGHSEGYYGNSARERVNDAVGMLNSIRDTASSVDAELAGGIAAVGRELTRAIPSLPGGPPHIHMQTQVCADCAAAETRLTSAKSQIDELSKHSSLG